MHFQRFDGACSLQGANSDLANNLETASSGSSAFAGYNPLGYGHSTSIRAAAIRAASALLQQHNVSAAELATVSCQGEIDCRTCGTVTQQDARGVAEQERVSGEASTDGRALLNVQEQGTPQHLSPGLLDDTPALAASVPAAHTSRGTSDLPSYDRRITFSTEVGDPGGHSTIGLLNTGLHATSDHSSSTHSRKLFGSGGGEALLCHAGEDEAAEHGSSSQGTDLSFLPSVPRHQGTGSVDMTGLHPSSPPAASSGGSSSCGPAQVSRFVAGSSSARVAATAAPHPVPPEVHESRLTRDCRALSSNGCQPGAIMPRPILRLGQLEADERSRAAKINKRRPSATPGARMQSAAIKKPTRRTSVSCIRAIGYMAPRQGLYSEPDAQT